MNLIPTYVASGFGNKKSVKKLMKLMTALNCKITHDWTNDDVSNVPEVEREKYLHDCAVDSLNGVEACELFVLLCSDDMAGAYVEFGVAAALGKSCIIVGADKKGQRDCIFYHLQNPAQLFLAKDEDELIELLKKAYKLGQLIMDELEKDYGTKEQVPGNN